MTRYGRTVKILAAAVLAAASPPIHSTEAAARGEFGVEAGYSTNVDNSLEGGAGDARVSAFGSWSGETAWGGRTEWRSSAAISCTAFREATYLDEAQLLVRSGPSSLLRPGISFGLSPYLSGTVVRDSDQSAVGAGVTVSLEEAAGGSVYFGQYYRYSASWAHVDSYSFSEHALGLYAGTSWAGRWFAEAEYYFSFGDSFYTVPEGESPGTGPTRRRRYSASFDSVVIRDDVGEHRLSLTVGRDWAGVFFSQATAGYSISDVGSETVEAADLAVSTGFRF